MARLCGKCKKKMGFGSVLLNFEGKKMCLDCKESLVKKRLEKLNKIIITTSFNIDGKKVEKYLDVISAEVVIGTGIWSEFTGEINDFFGQRVSEFEKKLRKAKEAAMLKLREEAHKLGANAIISIDLDYSEFRGSKLMVVANGTAVKIK